MSRRDAAKMTGLVFSQELLDQIEAAFHEDEDAWSSRTSLSAYLPGPTASEVVGNPPVDVCRGFEAQRHCQPDGHYVGRRTSETPSRTGGTPQMHSASHSIGGRMTQGSAGMNRFIEDYLNGDPDAAVGEQLRHGWKPIRKMSRRSFTASICISSCTSVASGRGSRQLMPDDELESGL